MGYEAVAADCRYPGGIEALRSRLESELTDRKTLRHTHSGKPCRFRRLVAVHPARFDVNRTDGYTDYAAWRVYCCIGMAKKLGELSEDGKTATVSADRVRVLANAVWREP